MFVIPKSPISSEIGELSWQILAQKVVDSTHPPRGASRRYNTCHVGEAQLHEDHQISMVESKVQKNNTWWVETKIISPQFVGDMLQTSIIWRMHLF